MRDAETLQDAINYHTSRLTLRADGIFIELDDRFQSRLVLVETARREDESRQAVDHGRPVRDEVGD